MSFDLCHSSSASHWRLGVLKFVLVMILSGFRSLKAVKLSYILTVFQRFYLVRSRLDFGNLWSELTCVNVLRTKWRAKWCDLAYVVLEVSFEGHVRAPFYSFHSKCGQL